MNVGRIGAGMWTNILIRGLGFSDKFRYRCMVTVATGAPADERNVDAVIESDSSLSCSIFPQIDSGVVSVSLSRDGEPLSF